MRSAWLISVGYVLALTAGGGCSDSGGHTASQYKMPRFRARNPPMTNLLASAASQRVPVEQHEARQRQKSTVTAVGFALFNDVLLLLMLVPMLPSLLEDEGVSDMKLALLFTAKDICQMCFAPVAGAATLTFGARHSLTASLLALAASTVAFAEAKGYFQLLASRALQGATSAVLMSGGLTLIAETHHPEDRGGAIARAHSGLGIGAAMGPVFGGLLFDAVGRRATFYVAAVLVLASAAFHCYVTAYKPAEIITTAPSKGTPVAQMLALIRNRDIAIVSLATFAIFAAGGLYDTAYGLHVSEAFHLAPSSASLLFSIEPICYLLVMTALIPLANGVGDGAAAVRKSPSWLTSKVKLSALSLALTGLSLPLLPLQDRRSSVVASLLVHGVGYACKDVVGYGLLADLVDRHNVGSHTMVFSLADCADSAGYIFGPMAGFAVCRFVGSRSAGLLFAGLACAAIAPLVLTTSLGSA